MKRTLVLTMGLVVVVALVGCGGSNPAGPGFVQEHIFIDPARVQTAQEEPLVGVWESMRAVITFKKGGEVAVTGFTENRTSVTVSGTYKVDDNKLALTTNVTEDQADSSIRKAVRAILSQFVTYTYSIKGDVLSLTNHSGEETRWEKR